MLWKDDSLEVVFDPGTDKVEQWALGPASTSGGDTGSATPAFGRRSQPRGNLTAELQHSSRRCCIGQFSTFMLYRNCHPQRSRPFACGRSWFSRDLLLA